MKDSVIQSIIFGFGHRARSGKDTAAVMVKEGRGIPKGPARQLTGNWADMGIGRGKLDVSPLYDIRVYSFAGELKREVNENAMKSGGMIRLFDEGLRVPDGGYLQENGNIIPLPEWVQYEENPDMTDPLCPYGKQRTLLQWWGTEFRRSVNENYWVDKLAERIAEEKPEIAIITDMRFPNEMRFVQKYGEAIRVDRPSLPPLQGAAGVHASELALANVPEDYWDAIIKNDGTLAEFRERVLFTFDMLMSTHPLQRPASV
jgi:hypothetical protein